MDKFHLWAWRVTNMRLLRFLTWLPLWPLFSPPWWQTGGEGCLLYTYDCCDVERFNFVFVLAHDIYLAPPPFVGYLMWGVGDMVRRVVAFCLCARLSMIGRQVLVKVGLIHLWMSLSFPWSLLEKWHAHSLTLKCRLISHWQILFTHHPPPTPHPTSPSPQSLQWLVQKYICHSLPTLTAPQLHRSTKCFLMVVNYSLITRKG